MVHYIPILTTLFAIFFFNQIYRHYRAKPGATYLFWWTMGVLTFGLGTLTESIHALFGWHVVNLKVWYVVGALLGGFPLAQGTVYLLLKKRVADILTVVFLVLIGLATAAVGIVPVSPGPEFDGRLTGSVFAWQWVRAFSPFINLYSFVFLFGGAVYSAFKYARLGRAHTRFLGNVFIAIGALLPGIGGTFTRFGYVEMLFITELIGLVFIYFGYRLMLKDRTLSIHLNQRLAWQEAFGK